MRFRKPPPAILCCYAELYVETERSVKAFAPDALFIYTGGDDYAYRDALQEYWPGDQDLIVIEQDIEITADVLPSFSKCRKPWCIYSYQGPPHLGYLHRCLGCTKFSPEMRKRFPFNKFDLPSMKWNVVDMNIAGVIGHTLDPHVHGSVNHYHSYKKVIEGLAPDEILWSRESNIDDSVDAICKELQPDGRTFVFYVNEDGTRGRFKRIVPAMPKYADDVPPYTPLVPR